MAIKMLKIHDRNSRIYVSACESNQANPVIQYGCTQEITNPDFIERWVRCLRSKHY
ncbi:MAG TPA: hypothetical protein PLC07_12430 [Bacillota bacterium]|nr:hypothetical protein [Bacillota bacterium]